jgi:hypothetical protein
MAIAYPLVNGEYPDFASITMDIAGSRIPVGLDELNFEDGLEPGEVRGNASQLIGTTRGEYSASADFSCPLPQMQGITALLAARGGVYSTRFNIVINIKRGSILDTVEILGARLKKSSDAHQQGSDALKRKAELHVMGIIRNGELPYPEFKRP